MPNWLQGLLDNGVFKAKALKWLRWAANGAGVFVMSQVVLWLTAHFNTLGTEHINDIALVFGEFASGAILSIGAAVFSIQDVNNVDAKLKIAAATGSLSQVDNVRVVKAVKAAGNDNEALQNALAYLKGGGK